MNTSTLRGDVILVKNLSKFKPEYRNATGTVIKWNPDNIYTVLINGNTVALCGDEFDIIYKN